MLKQYFRNTRIRAVAFDVYGTLVEIAKDTEMFQSLQHTFSQQGKTLTYRDRDEMMRRPLGFRELPAFFGIQVPEEDMEQLEQQLAAEIDSIVPYPDARDTLLRLKNAGYKIALCSNLSVPYVPPIVRLFEDLVDVFIWSFEAGAVKPEPEIYRVLCEKLQCTPEEVLMVGDSLKADHAGPRASGLHGFHLVRDGEAQVPEHFRSLTEVADWLTGPHCLSPS